MRFDYFETFLKNGKDALANGPVAFIFAEDDVEIDSTVRHHLQLGFKSVVLFGPKTIEL